MVFPIMSESRYTMLGPRSVEVNCGAGLYTGGELLPPLPGPHHHPGTGPGRARPRALSLSSIASALAGVRACARASPGSAIIQLCHNQGETILVNFSTLTRLMHG